MNHSYSLTPEQLGAGSLADNGFTDKVSCPVLKDIEFGVPAMRNKGEEGIFPASVNKFTLTLSGVLVTANVLTITVNGTAVATTFVTDNATTADAVCVAMQAAFPGSTCTVNPAGLVYTFTWKNNTITTATAAVTAGATQATVVKANAFSGVYAGVVVQTNRVSRKYTGGLESAPVLQFGRIKVKLATSVQKDDDAYVDLTTGLFTNVSGGGNVATGGVFNRSSLYGETVTEAQFI